MTELKKIFQTTISAGFAAIAVFATALTLQASEPGKFMTADTVSLDPQSATYFRNFAPELAKTLARVPQINPETGLFVDEVRPNLFYVTEGIYQSAFLKTKDGVIVFDAPPSFANKLPGVIGEHAPDQPIKYLIYSHGHADHVGGASTFGEVDGLTIIAASKVADALRAANHPGIIQPTITFEDSHKLKLGGETVKLKTASFHSENVDTVIYLPRQKFVMAVDTITPGEVPFMNFGATSDVGRYLEFFDMILEYDFDFILSGHVSILGNREDVIEAREYAFDVHDSVLNGMQTFLDRFNQTLESFEYKNPNLAYRVAMESIRNECAASIIEKWKDRLSVVDVWADSHCETILAYSIMH